MKRVLAVLLAAVLMMSLSGCFGKESSEVQEQVRAMLDCDVTGDTEGAYELLYPGVAEKDAFQTEFQSIRERFPLSEDYRITLENSNIRTQVGVPSRLTASVRYRVEDSDQTFYLEAEYLRDGNGSGFTVCRFVDRYNMVGAK